MQTGGVTGLRTAVDFRREAGVVAMQKCSYERVRRSASHVNRLTYLPTYCVKKKKINGDNFFCN